MKRALIIVLLVVCATSHATIRRVAKDGDGTIIYNNIQTAINNCVAGDTVIVSGNMGPWTPSPQIVTIDRRIVLLGQGGGCNDGSGPNTDIYGRFSFTSTSDGSVAKGFRLSLYGGSLVSLATGTTEILAANCTFLPSAPNISVGLDANCSITVSECILITDGDDRCVYINGSQSSAILKNCVLASSANGGTGIDPYGATTSVWVSNCIFVNVTTPIMNEYANWYLDHNIFWDNGTWNGTVSGNVTASYNAMDNAAFTNFPGTNKINLQGLNPFVSYDNAFTECAEDFHLHPVNGAALINGGDPNAPNDRDGTRRDLGIYGGPNPYVDTGAPDFPFVTNFFVPVSVPQNGVLEIRSTGRVGQGVGQ